jgi:hypothetical protein
MFCIWRKIEPAWGSAAQPAFQYTTIIKQSQEKPAGKSGLASAGQFFYNGANGISES